MAADKLAIGLVASTQNSPLGFWQILYKAVVLVKFSHNFSNLLYRWRSNFAAPATKRARVTALLASAGVTALLLGMRQSGMLQPMELWAYDLLLRNRLKEATDPRLLVVEVTEADIQRVGRFPLPDATLATLLEKLQQYQPRVIGLDIYRDLAMEPGHQRLNSVFKTGSRIVAICKLSDASDPGVAPPPTVSPDRISFSDLPLDPDGIVRRALLFASAEGKCPTPFSFSFQLATRYLDKEGIKPKNHKPEEYLKLGNVVFRPIEANSGSYQGVDARGYQILLNYRSTQNVARQVSLSQVLDNQVKPEWVRDRIVLIGTTAPSVRDTFNTPYNAVRKLQRKMPGVVIHAQIVSQILSAVLDKRPLLRYWPWWGEALWVWGWALVGGLVAMKLRHPLRLLLVLIGALGGLVGVSWGLLILGVWIPLLPPALAVVATGACAIATIAYQIQQQQEKVGQLAQEQEQTIALLTTMLKEGNTKTLTADDWANQVTQPMENWDGHTHPIASPSPDPSASLDGRYKITSVLGQGGFGQTYLAEDIKRPGNPICVVKYLMPARQDAKFLQVARRLFETEAKILEALGRHTQIPQLLAYFVQNEQFYLVEEYIEGHPLSDELTPETRLSEVQVVEILKDVLEVLDFIHKHHVIHRDIKPGNIIRSKQDGLLVLIDFGAVKQMQPHGDGESQEQTIAIGTKGYAPPEQFHGRPHAYSDIYALGMIGIQALTGIPPFQLEDRDPNTGNIIWRHLANVSDELAAILDKMVEYHFISRYQSASEVLQDINRLDLSKLSSRTEDLRKAPTDSNPDTLHLSEYSDDATVKVDPEDL